MAEKAVLERKPDSDGLAEDGDDEALHWFADTRRAFAPLRPAEGAAAGEVAVEPLLAACRQVLQGYPLLYSDGMVARILMGDFSGNIEGLQGAYNRLRDSRPAAAQKATSGGSESAAAPITIRELTEHEKAAAGGSLEALKANGPGVWGCLWCLRTLTFVCRLLDLLRTPGREIADAGRQTYEEVLRHYHAPVMGWIVKQVLWFAPYRKTVLERLKREHGLDEAAVAAHCGRVVEAMQPVLDSIRRHYEEGGMDFPDKASALPFGM